jgi:hypothetical protein
MGAAARGEAPKIPVPRAPPRRTLSKREESMSKNLGCKVAWAGRTIPTMFWPPSLRAAFLGVVAVTLSYGAALLIVVYAYRRAYGISGKAELALWWVVKNLTDLKRRIAT